LGTIGYRWACYFDEGMGSALLPLRSKNARDSYPSRLLRPKTPGRLNKLKETHPRSLGPSEACGYPRRILVSG
jgi:hypothetical protein